MATPLVYPGQTVRARVIADPSNAGEVRVASAHPRLRRGRRLVADRRRAGRSFRPARRRSCAWRLPDTGGQPIQSLGLVLRSSRRRRETERSSSTICDGTDRRTFGSGGRTSRASSGERAWVNAVSIFSTSFPQAFPHLAGPRRRHDHPRRAAMDGLRVETALTVHLGRVRGRRRAGAGPAPVLRGDPRAAGLACALVRAFTTASWPSSPRRRSRGPSRSLTRSTFRLTAT